MKFRLARTGGFNSAGRDDYINKLAGITQEDMRNAEEVKRLMERSQRYAEELEKM